MTRLRARLAARYERWLTRHLHAAHRDWSIARLAQAATIGTPAAATMEAYALRARRRLVVWETIWRAVYGDGGDR